MGEGAALDAARLADLLERVHANLAAHRVEIDDLNVFPVPDGDTGTNMVMTVRATLDGLRGLPDGEDRCRAITRAAMRGARGNSGVILSQVLRALAETIETSGALRADGVAAFLERARGLAYEAVAEPVEGTILSAITAAAVAAREAVDENVAEDIDEGDAVVVALERARAAVHRAVARTPDQLEVLRTSGVVDAGARGFALVIDAILAHASGSPAPESTPARVCRASGEVPMADAGSLTYRFEVQYLIDADETAAPGLRRVLEGLGDSVVVVAAGDLMSVHVHTNDVGAAIEAGVEHGRPSGIEVTYFAEQIAAHAQAQLEAGAVAAGEAAETSVADPPPPATLGCVVVLPGPGLRTVAEGLGAAVVDGGPGALPSVADLLNAIGDVRAERIAILPGHRNVVPAAIQASDVSVAEGGRTLDVVTSADTTPAALAALAVTDRHGDAEQVLADMAEAAASVRSGEVVAAVRDAETPIGDIGEGQWLAVVDGDVVAVTDDPVVALRAVIAGCAEAGCDLVTLVTGADVDEAEARAAESAVRDAVGDAEVQLVAGGQRPARYFIGVE